MRYYGALEAGGTKMVMAIWTEDGAMTERVSIPTRTPEETMPEMIAFFRQRPIVSLGIGNFGPLDLDPASPAYGSVTMTPKLAWRGYPVLLDRRLHLRSEQSGVRPLDDRRGVQLPELVSGRAFPQR